MTNASVTNVKLAINIAQKSTVYASSNLVFNKININI